MDVFKAVELKKAYSQRLVVNGISMTVSSGEIIGLLGRNGAGKTTTFQMMVGLVKPNSGTLLINEQDISIQSTHERALKGIIYLPQDNSVFLKTSVENNIKMILEMHQHGKETIEKKTDKLMEELGLTDLAKQSAHSLSGGESRRLEICRSLVLEPKFLLLDEPFTGIDPITIKELQNILLGLKQRGIGIIISDHNVQDTFKITNYAYVIDEGEILIEGPPQTIAADETAKERFLGKNFKFGQEVESYSF